jgi:hypothetical protein
MIGHTCDKQTPKQTKTKTTKKKTTTTITTNKQNN